MSRRNSASVNAAVCAGVLVAFVALALLAPDTHAQKPKSRRIKKAYPNIASAAEAYNLTTLVQVVSFTPLFPAASSNTTAVTVFAPTNAAFATAVKTLREAFPERLDILSDIPTLTKIIYFHIVGKPYTSADLKTAVTVVPTILSNQTLTISRSGRNITIAGASNQANVIRKNIRAGNSFMHIIDAVLLPKLA